MTQDVPNETVRIIVIMKNIVCAIIIVMFVNVPQSALPDKVGTSMFQLMVHCHNSPPEIR